MTRSSTLSRRQLLRASFLTFAGLLAACDGEIVQEEIPIPSPAPSPTPEPDDTTLPSTPTPEIEPTPTVTPALEPLNLIITGGTVINGTGTERFTADVGLRDDRIVAIGDLSRNQAEELLDATDKFVVPGFINTHSHVEEWVWEGRPLTPSLLQGVTTEIAGMDGESAFEIGAHLSEFEHTALEVNYGTMIGHAVVRRAVLGDGPVQPEPGQLEEMRMLVEQGLHQGAFGLSSGLEYEPGMHASHDEILALAEFAAGFDAVYNTHIRDEGQDIIAAVDEAIDVGRQTGVTVIITHLKVRRAAGWPQNPAILLDLTEQVIERIHTARAEGIDVWADLYPYTSTWGNIERSLAEMIELHPPEIMTISRTGDEHLLDRAISELADDWGVTPTQAALQVLAENPDARVALQGAHPDGVRRVLEQQFTIVAIDNPVGTGRWAHPAGDVLHRRSYGTYPRLLGQYVRDEGLLSWEEAIHRSTGLPARLYSIAERGLIQEGYFADLVVLDPETIQDRTTYAFPDRHPGGIEHMLINGLQAVREGELVPDDGHHRTPGRVLRRA